MQDYDRHRVQNDTVESVYHVSESLRQALRLLSGYTGNQVERIDVSKKKKPSKEIIKLCKDCEKLGYPFPQNIKKVNGKYVYK